MKQFYLFYAQDDMVFQQVGGKVKNSNLQQVVANLQIDDNKNKSFITQGYSVNIDL